MLHCKHLQKYVSQQMATEFKMISHHSK